MKKATHVLSVSFEIKFDKVLVLKLHKYDDLQYHMKMRYKENDTCQCYRNKRHGKVQVAEMELYQACEGMVHKVMEIVELPVRDKTAWIMNLFVLVSISDNVSGCELFNNKLSRSLVV